MKTKSNSFVHTVMIITILFFTVLASTTIIYAILGMNTNISVSSADNNTSENDSAVSSKPASSKGKSSPDNNSSSVPTAPQKPASNASITISAVGDLMAHQGNLNCAYNSRTGTYDFNGFLQYVRPYLANTDLAIGNFETVTAGSASGYTSYPLFNTPDAMLTALGNTGFDALSTANNHCLDRGIPGLVRTIKKINENKMINVGSSVDGKNKYIIKEIKQMKVGILSYSSTFNGNDNKLDASQKSRYLSAINELQIMNDIRSVKANGTDAVIVITHWGTEYTREPDARQAALSKKILSWGADILLGSHPHVIQKSEIRKVNNKNKFVIYSMGNFISGYRRTDRAKRPNKIYTEDGVIVNLKIEKDPGGGILIKNVDYIPTWVDRSYMNGKAIYKIIPIPVPNPTGPYVNQNNIKYLKQSYKNTMSIMAKLN